MTGSWAVLRYLPVRCGPLVVSAGNVRFEDVRFAYEPARPILRGLNFDVPAGRTVILEVSTGTIKLPDVRGKKIADALALIPSEFTKRTQQEKITSVPGRDQTVADESPQPGNAYPVSQQIVLTVYKYVKPKPTCTTPPPTPTTSPSPTSSSGLPAC